MVDGPIRKVEQRMAVQRRWLRFTDHRADCIAPPASRFSPAQQFNVPSGQSLDDHMPAAQYYSMTWYDRTRCR